MGPKKVSEILHDLAECHKRLAEKYADISTRVPNEELKVLLAHLCRIEQYMEQSVHDYAHTAPQVLRESWLRTVPDIDATRLANLIENSSFQNTNEVIDAATAANTEIQKIYQELIRNAETEELRSIFSCLLEMTNEEMSRILRSSSFY